MFAAVKQLKGTGPRQEVTVHDKFGEIISDTGKAAAAIAEHFSEQFTAVDETKILTFSGDPGPFQRPISMAEVQTVVKQLKNRKAAGPDGLTSELLKAAGGPGAEFVAEVLNKSFERHA